MCFLLKRLIHRIERDTASTIWKKKKGEGGRFGTCPCPCPHSPSCDRDNDSDNNVTSWIYYHSDSTWKLIPLSIWLALTHYQSLVSQDWAPSGIKSDQLCENQTIKTIVNNHLRQAAGGEVQQQPAHPPCVYGPGIWDQLSWAWPALRVLARKTRRAGQAQLGSTRA